MAEIAFEQKYYWYEARNTETVIECALLQRLMGMG